MQHVASQTSAYKMAITERSKTLVTVYRTKQHNTPQRRNLNKNVI